MRSIGLVLCVLGAALLLRGAPAGAEPTADKTVIRFATMAPRTSATVRALRRGNKELEEATGGRVSLRVYWGGSAGDERTVLRKMRAGQIDASLLGLAVAREFMPEVAVLGAPATFETYEQVDRVREALAPELAAEAYEQGFKVFRFWDAGRTRLLSRAPVRSLEDLKRLRLWLYEDSAMLSAFYRMVGATGVPLSVTEILGALRTRMLDVVWSSAWVASAFQWHTEVRYVSEPLGLLQGVSVLRRPVWDGLREEDQRAIWRLSQRQAARFQRDFRRDDERVYARLLERGITFVPLRDRARWDRLAQRLRDRMAGRLYSRAQLERVQRICAQHAP